jgi:hypothetical protein
MTDEAKKLHARVTTISLVAEVAMMEKENDPVIRHMAALELLCRLCGVFGPEAGPKMANEIKAVIRRATPDAPPAAGNA